MKQATLTKAQQDTTPHQRTWQEETPHYSRDDWEHLTHQEKREAVIVGELILRNTRAFFWRLGNLTPQGIQEKAKVEKGGTHLNVEEHVVIVETRNHEGEPCFKTMVKLPGTQGRVLRRGYKNRRTAQQRTREAFMAITNYEGEYALFFDYVESSHMGFLERFFEAQEWMTGAR